MNPCCLRSRHWGHPWNGISFRHKPRMLHRIFFNPIKFPLPCVYLTTCKVLTTIYNTQSLFYPLFGTLEGWQKKIMTTLNQQLSNLRKSSQTIKSHGYSGRYNNFLTNELREWSANKTQLSVKLFQNKLPLY